MRRLGSVLSFVVAAAVLAGQSASAQTIHVKGGVTLAQVAFDDGFAETTSLAPGLQAGGSYFVSLPWKLGLVAEGLLTVDRATVGTSFGGGLEDRFRYLDVPVVLRRQVPLSLGGRDLFVVGGIQYRHLLGASEADGDASFDISDGVSARDLALVLGADAPLMGRLSIEGRFLMGSEEIYRRLPTGYTGRWRGVQIGVRYAVR